MSFGPLGIWEILVIVGVALLIFGPTQLPKIARGVGKAVRSANDFKDEITGAGVDDEAPKRPSRRSEPSRNESESAQPRSRAPGGAESDPVVPRDRVAGSTSAGDERATEEAGTTKSNAH